MENTTPTCPSCGAGMAWKGCEVETLVGSRKVKDSSGLAWCCGCGDYVVSGDALTGYERRAARTVLIDVCQVEGAEFKYARRALDLTQPELGLLLDVTPETISRWENDRDPISRSTQLAVATLLEVSLQEGDDGIRALLGQAKAPTDGPISLRVKIA